MSSTHSNDPATSISSIREELGPDIEAVLTLGEELARTFETWDSTGRWMAIHLASLVHAARGFEPGAEQRTQIVDLILKIWKRRFRMPGGGPTAAFGPVLAGLERLGDDRPWAFSRLPEGFSAADVSGLPAAGMLQIAADLERLSRRTIIRLFWLATREAGESNKELLDLADKVASNVESDASAILARLMAKSRRLRTLMPESAETDTVFSDALAPDDFASVPDETFNSETINSSDEGEAPESPLSRSNNVAELRSMAALLSRVADELEGSATQTARPAQRD